MKKITLMILLTFSGNFVFSQTLYSNYLDMTSEWRNYSGGWNGVSAYSNYTTTYFDGLETINGKVYYKRYSKNLYNTTTFSGTPISELTLSNVTYFREDADGNFYFINPNTNLEEVFFNNMGIVNAQVGDPFPYPGAGCNVQSTETIYLGSVPLKKINGTVSSSTTGSLEGIGIIGLACAIGIEYNGYLNCYTKQGINIQFGTINCNSFPIPIRVNLSTDDFITNEDKIDLFPNPTNGIFKIKVTPNFLHKTFEIYDIHGALLEEGKFLELEKDIDITNYSSGIYFIKIMGEDFLEYKKIIKE